MLQRVNGFKDLELALSWNKTKYLAPLQKRLDRPELVYACAKGYMAGVTVVCTSSGNWSDDDPSCVPETKSRWI